MSGKLTEPASRREVGVDRGDARDRRRRMKILLVDHCPATRVGVKQFLREGGDAEVVGEASGAEEALRLSDELCPDLVRSEEHTSELQSRQYLVCRLLLEKKKKK